MWRDQLNWWHGTQVNTLLAWFLEISSTDEKALLEFPPGIGKEQRALLHGSAQALGLGTSSQGYGEERFLTIYPKSVADYMGGKIAMSDKERAQANQLWDWITAEGGEYSQFSRNEVEEMVVSGKLNEKLEQLMQRHTVADSIYEAALVGDLATIDDILAQDRSLINVTSKEHQALPLYGACTGRGSSSCPPSKIVLHLLQHGASINALNSEGMSTLHLCRRLSASESKEQKEKEFQDVLEVLEQNGAHDIAGWPKKREGKFLSRRVNLSDLQNRAWRDPGEHQALKAMPIPNISPDLAKPGAEGSMGLLDWDLKESIPARDGDSYDFFQGGEAGQRRQQFAKPMPPDTWAGKERREPGDWDARRAPRGTGGQRDGGPTWPRRNAESGSDRDQWRQGSGFSGGGGFGGGDGRQRGDRSESGGKEGWFRTDPRGDSGASKDWRQESPKDPRSDPAVVKDWRQGDAPRAAAGGESFGWRQGGGGKHGEQDRDKPGRWPGSVSNVNREDEMAQLRGITVAKEEKGERRGDASSVQEGSGGSGAASQPAPKAVAEEDEENMIFRPVLRR